MIIRLALLTQEAVIGPIMLRWYSLAVEQGGWVTMSYNHKCFASEPNCDKALSVHDSKFAAIDNGTAIHNSRKKPDAYDNIPSDDCGGGVYFGVCGGDGGGRVGFLLDVNATEKSIIEVSQKGRGIYG